MYATKQPGAIAKVQNSNCWRNGTPIMQATLLIVP